MTDLFLDAEEQKQKEIEKELKNTHPIAQAHEAKDNVVGTRIKVEDLSQQNKDFLTEAKKEQADLNDSMNQSLRNAEERKKNILKTLEENQITNFQTPESKIKQDLEYDMWLKAKLNKTDLSKVMTPEEEDRNAGVERDENGNVKSEQTK
jgi:hypothetical protein